MITGAIVFICWSVSDRNPLGSKLPVSCTGRSSDLQWGGGVRAQFHGGVLRADLPGLTGLCMQFCDTMPGWTEVEALLLRSMTEGDAEVACWRPDWCGLGSCWFGLGGMPFSERNSSRSMYSNWKVSPSYGSVLSHNVGPKKAD